MIDALNLYELEKLAKEKLPQSAYGYYSVNVMCETVSIFLRDFPP